MNFDIHIVLYKLDIVPEIQIKLDTILTNIDAKRKVVKPMEVVGSTEGLYPKAILTIEISSLEETIKYQDKIYNELKKLNIDFLIESEQNFSLANKMKEYAAQSNIAVYYLNNTKRSNADLLHWGDIHIDIPLNYTTRKIRNALSIIGFSYIITIKKERQLPHAIMTCQFTTEKVMYDILRSVAGLYAKMNIKKDQFKIKGEKLIKIDINGTYNMLPLTTGIAKKIYLD